MTVEDQPEGAKPPRKRASRRQTEAKARKVLDNILSREQAPDYILARVASTVLRNRPKPPQQPKPAPPDTNEALNVEAVKILDAWDAEAAERGDLIPAVGSHRAVRLHDQQDEARLSVSRYDLDVVFAMDDPRDLLAFAQSIANAPEARLLAACKGKAILEKLFRQRRVIDLSAEEFDTAATGLNSSRWRSPIVFGSDLDPLETAVRRPQRLPDPA